MQPSKPQVNSEALKLSLLFAAYLIIIFLTINLGRTFGAVAFLHTILVVCTPIVFYKITKYQVALSGAKSYLRIFLHAINIYLFASLLLAAVQYIYYEYIAPGEIMRMMEQSLEDMRELFPQMAEQFQNVDMLELINGAVFAMAFFQMNLLIGLFLSLIISAIIARKVKSNPA